MLHQRKLPSIALSGYMGSGKSEIAKNLVERYGYTQLAFADPLKDLYLALVERPIAKDIDRPFLQQLGGLGRAIDSTLWIDKMLRRLEALVDAGNIGPFVVSDVRYRDEQASLRFFDGAKAVHVDTPLYICQERVRARDGGYKPEWFYHETEQIHAVLEYDAGISGVGDVSENVDALLRRLTDAQP